jgi:hypothetical protein
MYHKVKKFLYALYWHIYRGLPKTNRIDLLYRYQICKQCNSFENYTCLECGCNVNDKSIFLNKLAWADQECPLGKWGKIDDNQRK